MFVGMITQYIFHYCHNWQPGSRYSGCTFFLICVDIGGGFGNRNVGMDVVGGGKVV